MARTGRHHCEWDRGRQDPESRDPLPYLSHSSHRPIHKDVPSYERSSLDGSSSSHWGWSIGIWSDSVHDREVGPVSPVCLLVLYPFLVLCFLFSSCDIMHDSLKRFAFFETQKTSLQVAEQRWQAILNAESFTKKGAYWSIASSLQAKGNFLLVSSVCTCLYDDVARFMEYRLGGGTSLGWVQSRGIEVAASEWFRTPTNSKPIYNCPVFVSE